MRHFRQKLYHLNFTIKFFAYLSHDCFFFSLAGFNFTAREFPLQRFIRHIAAPTLSHQHTP